MPDYSEFSICYDYFLTYFPKKLLNLIHITSNISRVAALSSCGLTSDSQVKSDIVALGTYILSLKLSLMTKNHNVEVNDTRGNDNTETANDIRNDY